MNILKKISTKLKQKTKFVGSIQSELRANKEAKKAFSSRNTPPVLIYQMGKVGSKSIYDSLVHSEISIPILHLHFLSNDLPFHKRKIKQAGIYPYPDHIYIGESVSRALKKHPDFPVKVITLLRDPIAFVVSNLFQNPSFVSESIKDDNGNLDAKKIVVYLERKLREPGTFDYIYNWFDRELKAVFGIDVFEKSFPIEAGYEFYSKGGTNVLLIRLEDLNNVGPKAISKFLNIESPLPLSSRNERVETSDADIYREVLGSLCISESLCREIYSSRFVRHFYNEAAINKFVFKWTKNCG